MYVVDSFIALTVSSVLCVCAVSGPSISVSQMQAAAQATAQVRQAAAMEMALHLLKQQRHLQGSFQKGLSLSLAHLMSLWVELVEVAYLLLRMKVMEV